MSVPEADAAPRPEEMPPDLREVGVYATSAEASERGLVVLATGNAYWLVSIDAAHRLLVEASAYDHVRGQLERFEREQTRWPPPPIADPFVAVRGRVVFPTWWCIALLAIYWAQGIWPDLTRRAALDARAVIEDGEWWRTVTALFLHADADHLLANGFAGAFLFSAVLTTYGRARGWLLIAAASIATNALLALLSFPGSYRSLGASTAIFAALGMLTGRAVRVVARTSHPHRWRTMFIPFAAGLTTLALYGAGGQNVDLAAHAAGFVAGGLIGLMETGEASRGLENSARVRSTDN